MRHRTERQQPSPHEAISGIDAGNLRRPVSMVVAHPGHELLAFGWMVEFTPSVHIVTDGSGRDEASRIAASRRLLAQGFGTPGSVFGRWQDRELYQALSLGSYAPFVELRDELVREWIADGVATVMCDAYERVILMHDVVQLVACSAVETARQLGAEIGLVEMPNHIGPFERRPGNPDYEASLTLSELGLQQKLAAARDYDSPVIRHEVEAFLGARGEQSFAEEALYRGIHRTPPMLESEPRTAWEAHGERLCDDGVYERAIRLTEHVVPLLELLESSSDEDRGPGSS